jgi:serine/threonine protein phosphatase PrpC
LETFILSTSHSTIRWVFLELSSINRKYRPSIQPFTGNYINNIPEIEVFDKNSKVRGLLLATDGLWDELKRDDILKVYNNPESKNAKIFLSNLVECVLLKSADARKLQIDDLKLMPLGKRRSFHDDISIIYAEYQK